MTLFTTTIRLINASITGAITGAKDAILLEKQFMAWESELETLEIFDGYEGWIEVADDDIPADYDNCIVCDKLFLGELDTCSICHSQLDLLGNKILDHSEDGNTDKANQLNDLYVSLTNGLFIEKPQHNTVYHRNCICCEGLFITTEKLELMCPICVQDDSQIDITFCYTCVSCKEEFQTHDALDDVCALCELLNADDILNSYHMDNCSYEATGTCDCDLPF